MLCVKIKDFVYIYKVYFLRVRLQNDKALKAKSSCRLVDTVHSDVQIRYKLALSQFGGGPIQDTEKLGMFCTYIEIKYLLYI